MIAVRMFQRSCTLSAWRRLSPIQVPLHRTIVTDVSSSERYGELLKEDRTWPTLVFYTASWCAPCREVSPCVQDLSHRYPRKLRVLRVDVEENPELATAGQVESVPYFTFMRDKRVVERLTGANSDEVIAAAERHVAIAEEEEAARK
mmetsp:Transcript_44491/g.105435  ORF Transcript_44491/g.105435 Transcript_44491/m.105435 type:complete len:147 (-) Transcript_44491:38-478(-)